MSSGRATLLVAIGAFSLAAVAQDRELPVLRANSPRVDIQDGNRFLPGVWTVSPDTALDIYYARSGPGDRHVVFRSDIDALDATVRPGEQFDFEILLNGRRCCRTRISTLRDMPHVTGGVGAVQTIPFKLGANDKIHIAGSINGSQPLDLELDLGANSAMLFPSGLVKGVAPHVDGQADNSGTGGVVRRDFSNDNRLSIGGLGWNHVAFIISEKQTDDADGLVGFPQFDNTVMEIDYDAGVLKVGGGMPARAVSWTRLPVTYPHQLPAVPVCIEAGGASFDVPLVIDTGSNLSLFLNDAASDKGDLRGSLPRIGTSELHGMGAGTVSNVVLRLPALRLGNRELQGVPMHSEVGNSGADPGGHLGMDVLKRFNMVLDLRAGVVYLDPSRLASMPYRSNYHTGLGWKVGAIAAVLLALTIVILRRRRSRHGESRSSA